MRGLEDLLIEHPEHSSEPEITPVVASDLAIERGALVQIFLLSPRLQEDLCVVEFRGVNKLVQVN